jgi:hypothetical protein
LLALPDDTAKVISDWKMKILACYFRENQAKFFGKRGISLLGFMVISNSRDEFNVERGMKDVKFVFYVTDDTKQDEWSVMAAKSDLYANHLPDHVSKAWFLADGAGCFSSKLNRIIQPCWEAWTGIVEEEYRISPRGGGKTQLDGGFAKAGQVLSSSVDGGASYWDAESVRSAFEQSGGLTATKVRSYTPNRDNRFWGGFRDASKESVLRTTLNQQDLSLVARKHSDYGSGAIILQSNMFLFRRLEDSKRAMPKKKEPRGAASAVTYFEPLLRAFIGKRHPADNPLGYKNAKTLSLVLRKTGVPLVGLRGRTIESLRPACQNIIVARRNPKENLPSYKVSSF